MGRLVHDQLLADIEQARDRCKPDIILRKLQQELPASVVSQGVVGCRFSMCCVVSMHSNVSRCA